MSIPPKCSAACSTAASTCASSRISIATGSARPPASLDFLSCGVDGARQLRMRLGGLGGDDDVGPVARGAKRDGLADAAARAGDEQRFALKDSFAGSSRQSSVSCSVSFRRAAAEKQNARPPCGAGRSSLAAELKTGDCLLHVGVAAVLANPHAALLVHGCSRTAGKHGIRGLPCRRACRPWTCPRTERIGRLALPRLPLPASGLGLRFLLSAPASASAARKPARPTSLAPRQTALTPEENSDDRSS